MVVFVAPKGASSACKSSEFVENKKEPVVLSSEKFTARLSRDRLKQTGGIRGDQNSFGQPV